MRINVGIAGVGFHVPENIVTNQEFEKYVGVKADWIEDKIGIEERRFASKDQALSDLAFLAAMQALESAGLHAQDIDLIIVSAINPDKRAPATAAIMQKKLGAPKAAAFDINVGGCPGSCFFGDGVGAVVLRQCKENKGFLSSLLGADGEWGVEKIICEGGSRIPITREAFDNNKLVITMDNKEVWKFGTKILPLIVEQVTKDAGFQLTDLDWIIPHQSNLNMIRYGMKKLKLPMSKTYTNIHKFANTGGGSVLISLAEAVQLGLIKPGQLIVLSSFGAGFSWGSILTRWCCKEDFEF